MKKVIALILFGISLTMFLIAGGRMWLAFSCAIITLVAFCVIIILRAIEKDNQEVKHEMDRGQYCNDF